MPANDDRVKMRVNVASRPRREGDKQKRTTSRWKVVTVIVEIVVGMEKTKMVLLGQRRAVGGGRSENGRRCDEMNR
jgi:hypothetical protein